jgi:hypothetical protein
MVSTCNARNGTSTSEEKVVAMTHEYTPVPQLAPKPPQRRKAGNDVLYRLEQVFGTLFGFVAFAAAVVAVLTYFNILPPQLLPVVEGIEHTIFGR